ncbi:MAG: hypothetical protein Tsb0017_27460 [Geothermobacteraceae bacterium]
MLHHHRRRAGEQATPSGPQPILLLDNVWDGVDSVGTTFGNFDVVGAVSQVTGYDGDAGDFNTDAIINSYLWSQTTINNSEGAVDLYAYLQSWYQFFGQCIKVDSHALTKGRFL